MDFCTITSLKYAVLGPNKKTRNIFGFFEINKNANVNKVL